MRSTNCAACCQTLHSLDELSTEALPVVLLMTFTARAVHLCQLMGARTVHRSENLWSVDIVAFLHKTFEQTRFITQVSIISISIKGIGNEHILVIEN